MVLRGGGFLWARYPCIAPAPRQSHGILKYSRLEKTAHSVTRGSRLQLDLCHHDPISPFAGERIGLSRKSRLISLIGIVDPLNWIGPPIPFPPNLFFIFVVYFIRAHLRGASIGTRLSGNMDRS